VTPGTTLRRLKGSHTYDVTASALDDIHARGVWLRGRKIVRTTTDNGASFVKAFSVFASQRPDNTDDVDE